MNKRIMLAAALCAMSFSLGAQHLDGAYLADENYGASDDATLGEVNAQILAYTNAKADAEGIQAGEEGDLRAAQRQCVDTALYSWVKANYLAEMGRFQANHGNVEQAKIDYKEALACARTAQTVNCHEVAKTAKSKEQGAIIEKVIRRALKRLGVTE